MCLSTTWSSVETRTGPPRIQRVAVISAHGCPLARLGGRETGGMNVYVRELSRALGRMGIAVDIFTRWRDPQVKEVVEFDRNVRVIHLKAGPVEPLEKNSVYYHLPEFICRIRCFKEKWGLQYDLLHSHYWLSGRVGTLLQQCWQVPHVVMFHTLGRLKNKVGRGGKESRLRIETETRVIGRADRIIAASPHEKSQMVQFYAASPGHIEVIPCGVDVNLFHPMDKALARKQLGIEDEHVILFVGRMDPVKGMDVLLRAVARLEERAGLRLLIVGGEGKADPEIARLRREAAELGIQEHVSFCGAVEQTKLPLFYNAADVCLVPSYYESFGMVALEAMACGIPVIASRVGGLQSIVQDGETGFLIPWQCPEPFAAQLELLLANEALRLQLGHAAHLAAQKYAWPLIAERVLAVYESLLHTRQACKVL